MDPQSSATLTDSSRILVAISRIFKEFLSYYILDVREVSQYTG